MNIQELSRLSDDELHRMNRDIVYLLRNRSTMKQMAAATKLSLGAHVKFKDRQGRTVTIAIDRINQKSVTGHEVGGANAGRPWRVAPTLLQPA